MDPLNQGTVAATGSSKKGLYIVIGVLALVIIGFLMRDSLGLTHKVSVAGMNGEVTKKLDGSTTYTNDYGTVTTGATKVPDNWPSDAPVYTNATVSQSTTSNMMGTNGFQVTLTTSDSTQTILDFYKSKLTSSGWKSLYPGQAITGTQAGANTTLMAKKDNRTFMLLITTNKDTGKQVITSIVGTTPDTSTYKTGL